MRHYLGRKGKGVFPFDRRTTLKGGEGSHVILSRIVSHRAARCPDGGGTGGMRGSEEGGGRGYFGKRGELTEENNLHSRMDKQLWNVEKARSGI